MSKKSIRFFIDIFTSLVDTQWRWTLMIFAVGFFAYWLVFALLYWLIAFTHGDLQPLHISDKNWQPCVLNLYGFTASFLFSVETQFSQGYGVRTINEECPEAIFIFCAQCITGLMIDALLVGIVYAKMTRPKQRSQTILFSKNAVVSQREGSLCLMFRVGDLQKRHVIGASIRAQLVHIKKTPEGELLRHFRTELNLVADGSDGNLFVIWPATVVHEINEKSPFYYLSAVEMLKERFEIFVVLEGTVESTGQTTQARTSYLSSEILWGQRFESIISYNEKNQSYETNYAKFDHTIYVDTPLCSAAELDEFEKNQEIKDVNEQREDPVQKTLKL